MVYKQKCVAAIKVGGKILRESGDTVVLPFGSEYSILLKNMDSVRSKVSVFIDGENATDGTELIIGPNQNLELERFIKHGNLDAGNRFKFIERTEAIEDNRGIKIDDGLIRVEFKREKVVRHEHVVTHYDYDYTWPCPYQPWPWPRRTWRSGTRTLGQAFTGAQFNASNCSDGAQNVVCNLMKSADDGPSNSCLDILQHPVDNGITVPGSESHQQFYYAADFDTDGSEVIVIKLRGKVGAKPVSQPITVKSRKHCDTCGRSNEALSRFCTQCGTALCII